MRKRRSRLSIRLGERQMKRQNPERTSSTTAVLRVAVDKQTGCITSLLTSARSLRPSLPAAAATSFSSSRTRPRITTPGTSIPARSTLHPRNRQRRLSVELLGDGRKSRHPHHASLAKLEIRSDHQPLRTATKSTSTTRSTGTSRTSCSRRRFRSRPPATSPPTKFLTAPSTAPPRATTVGKKRSSKFRRMRWADLSGGRTASSRPERDQRNPSTATTPRATCCA